MLLLLLMVVGRRGRRVLVVVVVRWRWWVHWRSTVTPHPSTAMSSSTTHRTLCDHRDAAAFRFAVFSNKDHSSVEFRVVQCHDRVLGFLGGSVLDQTATFRPPTRFFQHYYTRKSIRKAMRNTTSRGEAMVGCDGDTHHQREQPHRLASCGP